MKPQCIESILLTTIRSHIFSRASMLPIRNCLANHYRTFFSKLNFQMPILWNANAKYYNALHCIHRILYDRHKVKHNKCAILWSLLQLGNAQSIFKWINTWRQTVNLIRSINLRVVDFFFLPQFLLIKQDLWEKNQSIWMMKYNNVENERADAEHW